MSLSNYSQVFPLIELQSTFYKLPMLSTTKRWRGEVPKDFEFSLKAFQGITHPILSPTWRKAGKQKPTKNVENYGHLKPTKENFECWDKTMEIYKALDAKAIVIQLPPSFEAKDEMLNDAINFLSSIKKPKILCIELRHKSWFKDLTKAKKLFEKVNAIHVTDPLVMKPLTMDSVSYSRLHGLGKKPYSYKYNDEELKRIKDSLKEWGYKESYVLFNNIYMKDNALKFLSLIR